MVNFRVSFMESRVVSNQKLARVHEAKNNSQMSRGRDIDMAFFATVGLS